MAKRRKKGGRRRQKIPIFATAGMIAGLLETYKAYKTGGTSHMVLRLTGYHMDQNLWNWKWATAGIPMIIGPAASMVASKAGLNRYVKVPYIKL